MRDLTAKFIPAADEVGRLQSGSDAECRLFQKQGRFIGFEVVAVGTRWGGTQYNCRGDDLAPAPFGAVLSLAGLSRAERVAPEHFRGYRGVDAE